MFKKHICDKIILMKKLMILFSLFFLFITSSVFAECINGNCVNGYGVYEIDDGNIYIGEYKNSLPNGKGYQKFLDKKNGLIQYVGEFKDGQYNGQGIGFFTLGESFTLGDNFVAYFVDEWKDGLKNGKGFELYSNGDVFFGEWKNDIIGKKISQDDIVNNPNSLPLCELNQSTTINSFEDAVLTKTKCFVELRVSDTNFSGEFNNGNINGLGFIINNETNEFYFGGWKDGDRYGLGLINVGDSLETRAIGFFKEDTLSGYGYFFNKQAVYLGEFKNNKFNNFGYAIDKEGDEYIGEWKSGKRHGQGKVFNHSGSEYYGKFKDHALHGKIIVKNEDGDIIKSIYNKGELIKVSEYRFANGDIFLGNSKYIERLESFVPHGFGKLTLVSGEKYEGEWFERWFIISKNEAIAPDGTKYFGSIQNKLPHGLGKAIVRNGDVFEGEWINGEPLKGKATLISGETYEGEYKNHKRHGFGILIDKDGKRFEGMFENGEFVK